MSSERQLEVLADGDAVANAIADRAVAVIIAAIAERGVAHVCLTGGRGGTSAMAAIGSHADASGIDWSKVEFWWSDERYLPEGDPQRNETGAREALLDKVDVDPVKVHPMPRSEVAGSDEGLDEAAAAYAQELIDSHGSDENIAFDINMLGIGEDAHCASLFPGRDEQFEPETVVAVRNSPKPPPLRTTFTMQTINASKRVWLIASGEGKADAVALIQSDARAKDAPSGAARGSVETILFADEAAASKLTN